MSEKSEGISQVKAENQDISRRSAIKKIGIATALAAAGKLTLEPKPVSADTPTPAATSTPKPTEVNLDTKLANLQTATAKQIEENNKKTAVADAERTATAVSKPPTATPRATETPKPTNSPIPTKTLTPPDKTATSEARIDEAYAKEKARLQAEYELKHPSPTVPPKPTVSEDSPKPSPSEAPAKPAVPKAPSKETGGGAGSKNPEPTVVPPPNPPPEGGIPWVPIIGGGATLAAAGAVWRRGPRRVLGDLVGGMRKLSNVFGGGSRREESRGTAGPGGDVIDGDYRVVDDGTAAPSGAPGLPSGDRTT